MQKKKMSWLCGVTFLIVGGGLTTLTILVKHEPAFYLEKEIPPSEERKAASNAFLRDFGQMILSMKQESWHCDISEAQLNSFFEEKFMEWGEGESLRKMGITSPRVCLEQDSMRFAFRYGRGWFSSVISYDLKIWLVPKEPNVIALEVLRARAGGLPISSRAILQQLSEYAQNQNYKVTLYRHESNPVAVIELQQYQPQSSRILTGLHVQAEKLTIQGKTLEHALPPLVLMKTP
jgi:hypothetical protein